MKKMFISVVALAMSVMAMATETAYVELRLTGNSGLYDEMTLTEDDSYTNAYEDGADATKIMYQANTRSVLIYGFVEGLECGDVAAANLDGFAIGFTTNMIDNHYTLSFELVDGRSLTLYDRVTNTSYDIEAGESFGFDVEASQVGQVAVYDRFFINLNSTAFDYSLTTNEYGWASYSVDENVVATGSMGLKIYKGALAGETLGLTQMDYVAADQGVVVYGKPNTTYYFGAGSGTSSFSGNDLKPASAWASHAGTIYCLKGDALYEYTGATMPANKAYLQVGGASAPRRISLRFNNEQGVENVKADVKAQKFVENGQILIKRGEDVYNLQGQIVK